MALLSFDSYLLKESLAPRADKFFACLVDLVEHERGQLLGFLDRWPLEFKILKLIDDFLIRLQVLLALSLSQLSTREDLLDELLISNLVIEVVIVIGNDGRNDGLSLGRMLFARLNAI